MKCENPFDRVLQAINECFPPSGSFKKVGLDVPKVTLRET
jgi:hypothetical protein